MLPLADDRTPDRVRAERRRRRLLGAAPSIAAHLAILAVVLLARPTLPVAVVEDAPISVSLVPGEKPSMKRWRVALYMWLSSNALSPTRFYHLTPGRVVELGTQVTI